MTRIVGHVSLQPERLLLRWSEGRQYFEPCAITGPELARLLQLAAEARQRLRPGAERSNQTAQQLAVIGHEMYRLILPERVGEIRAWLKNQRSPAVGDGLEVVGDGTGIIPWTLLYDQEPVEADFRSEQPGPLAWQPFWGVRYNLSTTARYNPLRTVRVLEEPSVLLALDPGVRESLPAEQQQTLARFLDRQASEVVASVAELQKRLRASTPDVLYLLVGGTPTGLRLGDGELSPPLLREMLQASEQGQSPWNNLLLMVNPCSSSPVTGWNALRQDLLRLQISGLVIPEEPLTPADAGAASLEMLEAFLNRGDPLCESLRNLRAAQPLTALGFTTTCPLGLQVQLVGSPPLAEPEPAELPPLPAEPYRPLRPCDRDDRPLLVGREDDIAQVAQLVDAPSSRLVLIHGRAGVGKSSLLRAGVLPVLEDEAVGYRPLTDRSEPPASTGDAGDIADLEKEYPVVAVRTSTDLPAQLAVALHAFAAQPYRYTTPAGKEVTVDLGSLLAGLPSASEALRAGEPAPGSVPVSSGSSPDAVEEALRRDPRQFALLLDRLSAALPHELLVLIEQGEELYTLTKTAAQARQRREALDLLRALAALPGEGCILLTARTEYAGRILGQLPHQGVREYYLPALDRQELVDVILRPTLPEPLPGAAGIPGEVYRFQYEPSLPERVATEALQASNDLGEEALPLVQMTCARLVERVQADQRTTIQAADLKALGGVAGGTARFFDSRLDRLTLTKPEQRQLRTMLLKFGHRQPEGTLTRELVPEQELARSWRGLTPVGQVLDALSADEVRLLEPCWVGGRPDDGRYSLSSDVLLPVVGERQAKEETGKASWSRVVDLLWIFIPLLVLSLVYTWTWIRAYSRQQEEYAEEKKSIDQLVRQHKILEITQQAEMFPGHVAQVNLAAAAWKSGQVLRAQQLLHLQRVNARGLRGFEWYHLWRQVHGAGPALQGNLAPITGVAVSKDGQLAATACRDGQLKLWRLPEGAELVTVAEAQVPLLGVGLAEDGRTLAAAGEDGSVRLWQLERKEPDQVKVKLLHHLKAHKKATATLALSADGQLAVSGDAAGTVKFWEVKSGKEIASDTEHRENHTVHAVAISPDGKTVASGGADEKIILRDAAGKKLETLTGPAPVRALAFSADGKSLAAGCSRPRAGVEVGAIQLWDVAARKERGPVIEVSFPVRTLVFTASGQLAVGGQDQRILLLDPTDGKVTETLAGHVGWVGALARHGPGLLSGSYDTTVQIWDLPPTILRGQKDWICSLALSPDDRLLAAGGRDGVIKVWEVATGKEVRNLNGLKTPVLSLAFARRDKDLVLAAGDGSADKEGATLQLWKMDSDQPWKSIAGQHSAGITGVALSPDGKSLATASHAGKVRLFDLGTEAPKARLLEAHKAAALCVAFASGGKYLASGDAQGTVILWAPATGKDLAHLGQEEGPEKRFTGHTAAVGALAFSPDGSTLVSASADQTLKRWDVEKKLLLSTWRGHNGPVLTVAASPKGDVFVSGGQDATVKLWDVLHGASRFTLAEHTGPVRGVVFSSTRRLLATAGHDGTVRLYHAAPEEPPPPEAPAQGAHREE